MTFINRKSELKALEDLHKQHSAKLIILYGRRRVGKTSLLMEFARKHKALYLVARQEAVGDQLKKMSEEVAEFFKDEVIRVNPFQSYDALLTYLVQKDVPVFFDEFPYLVESHRPLPSILQEYWDKFFSKRKPFIILCGSSIRMMESLLGYKSPLYGRRTEQMLLEPLSFKDSCEFFQEKRPEEKVELYAVLGGIPAYLLEFNQSQSLEKNVREKILQKNTYLYQDVLFTLQQELHEPRTYYSILQSIAKGNTRLGAIMNDTGIDKLKINKYLSILQQLHLVERRMPITEKKSSRKGIYVLKDQFFRFWFRFVFGNVEYIEQGRQDILLKETIMPQLPQFVGFAYEDVVLEWIQAQYQAYLFGRWWDKGQEIDIVGINKSAKSMIFGEVKWKTLSDKQAKEELQKLEAKSSFVKWPAKKRDYILIAKRIQNKRALRKKGLEVFDVEDVVG